MIALGRASKRGSRYLRGLSRADRDDVLSTALLACWELRSTYNPAVSLDDWFMEALKDARRSFKQGEYVTAEEFNHEMAIPDDTSIRAETFEAAIIIAASFSDREHMLLTDFMAGASWREIMRTHHASGQEVGNITRKFNRLRSLIPERHERQRMLRTVSNPGQSERETPIDRELARLEMPPTAGKECPPCWRCMWFQGFLPAVYTQRITTPADAEVQAAIWRTEAEKIKIATAIQAGVWR